MEGERDHMDGHTNGTRKVHPALDFLGDCAVVGIVNWEGHACQVTSTRQQYSFEDAKKGAFAVAPLEYQGIAGRWDADDLQKFLDGAPGPTFGAVLRDTRDLITRYLELRRPQEASLVACWVVGTYFFPLFPAFPRLHLHGERGSGKSKLLQVIARLAFNGLHRLNPTPAVLFRLISPLRPTFCLDEMEGLSKQDRTDILSILHNGYKDGSAIDRVEEVAGTRRPVMYHVYAPIALAGIAGLNATTADRCIRLTMWRGTDKAKVNRYLPSEDEAVMDEPFTKVRAGCYRLALTRFNDVRRAWRELLPPAWLEGRHRELYAPLLTIAALADAQEDLGLTNDLLTIAEGELDERGGVSQDGEALFQMLGKWLSAKEAMTVRPKDVADGLSMWLDTKVTPEQAGQLLQRYGFPRDTPPRDKDGMRYRVSRAELSQVMGKYGYEAPVFDPVTAAGSAPPSEPPTGAKGEAV
jgi:hypothetical protein